MVNESDLEKRNCQQTSEQILKMFTFQMLLQKISDVENVYSTVCTFIMHWVKMETKTGKNLLCWLFWIRSIF